MVTGVQTCALPIDRIDPAPGATNAGRGTTSIRYVKAHCAAVTAASQRLRAHVAAHASNGPEVHGPRRIVQVLKGGPAHHSTAARIGSGQRVSEATARDRVAIATARDRIDPAPGATNAGRGTTSIRYVKAHRAAVTAVIQRIAP